MSQASGRVLSALGTVGAVLLFGLAAAIGTDVLQQRFFCEHMDGPVVTALSMTGLALLYLAHGQPPLLRGFWRSPDPSGAPAQPLDGERARSARMPELQPVIVSGRALLGRGLKLLRAHLPAIWLTNLIVSLPVLALQLGAPTLMRGRLSPLPGGALLGGMLVTLLACTLQVVGTAATLAVVDGEATGRRIGLKEALGSISPRLGDLLKTGLLYCLGVTLGFALGGIPALLFVAWFPFMPQTVMTEGLAGTRALRRCRDLTRGCRAQVFGLVLTFLAMSFVVYGLMSGFGQLFPGVVRIPIAPPATALGHPFRDVLNYPNYTAVTVVTYLLILLVQSYQAVCFTLLYGRLHDRRDGEQESLK
jgi:hypothetical protein